jgi:hypothetical protein
MEMEEARIAAIKTELRVIRHKEALLCQELAELEAPFQIGDTIEFGYPENRITGVVKLIRSRYDHYEASVSRILKDGSLGAQVTVDVYKNPKRLGDPG